MGPRLARRHGLRSGAAVPRAGSSSSASEVDTQAIRDIFPCGTPKQVAQKMKGFCDAGMRVFKLMEYGGMGGLEFGAQLRRQGA